MNDQSNERLTTADLAGRGHEEQTTTSESEMTREDTMGLEGQDRPDNVTEMRRDTSTGTQRDGETSYGDTSMHHGTEGAGTETSTPLIKEHETYVVRWQEIQTRFVDEPQESVKHADALVADVIQKLAQGFAEQRDELEGKWHSGTEVNTEDLRQALQQYRTFFNRLLAA
jgi:hypothetical protein